jgi:hypothetical protein
MRKARSAVFALFSGFLASAAFASDGVVGPANCDEDGFADVLATVDGSGGGTITFDCGTATIASTSAKSVSTTVTIDGGDAITFDGGGTSPFLQVFASANLTLKRLVLQNGSFDGHRPLENFGGLSLDAVVLRDSGSTESAIFNQGTLSISDSMLTGNIVAGELVDGGAILSDGIGVTIVGTTMANNSVNNGTSRTGGAIAIESGDLTISGSELLSNVGFDGGAIYIASSAGTVDIRSSTFSGNQAAYGAAIENWGSATSVSNSTIADNIAANDGGGIWTVAGSLTLTGVEFDTNSAGTSGGGVSCYGDALTVSASTFFGNASGSDGGGIYSTCTLVAQNVTLVDNSATNSGGGLYQNNDADSTLVFGTLDGNTGTFGGGLYNEGAATGVLHVANTLVLASGGGNCDGVFTSGGYNISDDTNCGSGFSGPGDINGSGPLAMLDFAAYGGPVRTEPPVAGNPAIDHVPVASCTPAVDARGVARPFGSACDTGAVEVNGSEGNDRIFANGFDPV